MYATGYATDLEYVHEVGFEDEFNGEVDGLQVEVLECEIVEEDVVREQLFAPNVNGVLRKIEGIAESDVAGG